MNTIFCEKRRAGARLLARLCAMILAGACLPALGEESTEAEETVTLASLPIDLTPGPAAPEENFTEDGYEDPTISVKMEKVTTEKAIYNVARVTIGDASQLRTYITAKGRTNKISALAEKAGAIVLTVTDDTSRSLDQVLAQVQGPATALAMNMFEDLGINQVSYSVLAHVSQETGKFSTKGHDPLGEVLTIVWRRDASATDAFSCEIKGYDPLLAITGSEGI